MTCQQTTPGLYKGTYGAKDLQPRIGFAWTPSRLGGKTVFRGAYSISSYLEGTGTNLRLPINPPFTPAETFVKYNNLALPDNHNLTGFGAGRLGQRSVCAESTLRVWDPHVQPAHHPTVEWNGAAAVGQQRHHPSGLHGAAWHPLDGSHALPAAPVTPEQCLCHAAMHRAELFLSGNPAFQSDISQISGTASVGSSNYHALQAVFQKRYSSGLQYQVAYTLSRCRTDNSGYYGNWGAQAAPANPVLPEPLRSES